jgi:hypothetical protein
MNYKFTSWLWMKMDDGGWNSSMMTLVIGDDIKDVICDIFSNTPN